MSNRMEFLARVGVCHVLKDSTGRTRIPVFRFVSAPGLSWKATMTRSWALVSVSADTNRTYRFFDAETDVDRRFIDDMADADSTEIESVTVPLWEGLEDGELQ